MNYYTVSYIHHYKHFSRRDLEVCGDRVDRLVERVDAVDPGVMVNEV